MVKALGLVILALGAAMLLMPIILAIWAFHTYSIGVSVDAPIRLGLWLMSGAALSGGGVLLLRRARRFAEPK